MEMRCVTRKGVNIAVVVTVPGEKVITDERSALDLAMTARYNCRADRLAVAKEAVDDRFFVLSSGLAGAVLQKYINYRFKIAFWGDFSHYTSKPLHDFICESNRGSDVFFAASEEEAVGRLAAAEAAPDESR